MGNDEASFLEEHKVGVVWKHETQTAMPEGDVPEISFVYTYADGASISILFMK